MDLNKFAVITDAAFDFLAADYGYTVLPAERGGIFGSAFVRRFVRDSLEIRVVFGDADSQHLCGISFRNDLDEDIVEQCYMERGLVTLLADRHPAFVHPTRSHLSNVTTPEIIIVQYAALLREFAIDIVQGDFSAFPTLMYVLHHVDRKFSGRAVRRFLGVYSNYENVVAAIEIRRLKPGYSDRADGFEIWKVEVDGHGLWFAGIPLDSCRDNYG